MLICVPRYGFHMLYCINMNALKHIICSVGICAVSLAQIVPVQADYQDFNPGYVLPDEYVTDSPRLTASEIESFLRKNGSKLAGMTFFTADGWLPTSEIIARASQDYNISAQYLLALLQKEQGLISRSSIPQKALDWATGFGVCDTCSMSDPNILAFKGFENQVTYAAKQMRKYLDYPHRYRFRTGDRVTVNGETFTIQNSVTAGLYNYTPHLRGNRNLWLIWQKYWFRAFADGMVLATEDPGGTNNTVYWVIQDGKKYKFSSKGVYISYVNSGISKTPKSVPFVELSAYPTGGEIRFPEYTILQGPGGARYMIRGGKRHAFANAEVFRRAGYHPEEVEVVSQDDIDAFPIGAMITESDLYPVGIVARHIPTGKVFYVEHDTRYLIPTPEILKELYSGRNIVDMSDEQLARFKEGPFKFYPAGTVVKSALETDTAVYLVTKTGLQPFTTYLDFIQSGYKPDDLKIVDPRMIASMPTLNPVTHGVEEIELPDPELDGTEFARN